MALGVPYQVLLTGGVIHPAQGFLYLDGIDRHYVLLSFATISQPHSG
jgi:hypothetical protein